MVDNDQVKRLMVLGQVSSGKSYLLNILGGAILSKKIHFEVTTYLLFIIKNTVFQEGKQNIPCTSQIKIQNQIDLLGNIGIKVDLIDSPGLFSSQSYRVEELLEEYYDKFQGKVNQLLVVVNINSEFSLQADLLFKLAKRLVSNLSNITLIFTKVNEISKFEIERNIIQWSEYSNDFDFQNVFFFGSNDSLQIIQYEKEKNQINYKADQQFLSLIVNSQAVQLIQYKEFIANDMQLIQIVESSANFVKKQIEPKVLVTFGQSKQGKSYLLNLLLGYCDNEDSQENAPFTVSEANQSCTLSFGTVANQQLFGPNFKEEKVRISVLDTPGVYNTQDTMQHQKQKQSKSSKKTQQVQQEIFATSMGILSDFENQMNNLSKRKMGRILLVIDSTSKFDEFQNNVIKIAQIITSDIQRILVMITKTNFIDEDQRVEIFQSWVDGLAEYNLKKIYFVGETLKEIQIFQNGDLVDGMYHFLSEIKFCNNVELRQLHEQENQEVMKFFQGKEGCFSLDNEVFLKDGKCIQLRQLQEGEQLLNLSTKQEDVYLTTLHSSQKLQLNFLQIQTKLVESTDNKETLWDAKQQIEISPNHLIFVKKNDNQKEMFIKSQFLSIGDQLIRYNIEGELRFYEIFDIQNVVKTGYIAPLTESGTIYVNGFLASCYSPPQSWIGHKIAHISMTPLIKYKQIQILLNKQFRNTQKRCKIQNNNEIIKEQKQNNQQIQQIEVGEIFNPYAQFLNNLFECKQTFQQ